MGEDWHTAIVIPAPHRNKNYGLYTYLYKVSVKIPSCQSPTCEYQGSVDAVKGYTLAGETAWINFPDPGFHRQVDGTLNPVTQCDANTSF